MRYKTLAIGLLGLLLSACVSVNENGFNPTASEQLLTSHASERAASVLDLRLPKTDVVYVDTDFVDMTPVARYAVAAVRAHTLGHGVALTDDRTKATVIVELRVAASSIDDVKRFVGIPALTVPSLAATGLPTALTTPDITLYQRSQRTGVVEIAATARNAVTGRLITAVGPVFAISRIVNHRLFIGLVSGNVIEPPDLRTRTFR